jgi:hypothetical protein
MKVDYGKIIVQIKAEESEIDDLAKEAKISDKFHELTEAIDNFLNDNRGKFQEFEVEIYNE